VGVDETEAAGKAGRVKVWGTGAELGGWGGARVIPSISPTCSVAATELSSARSPAAEQLIGVPVCVLFWWGEQAGPD
jgi:hypothetical protein